MESVSNSSSLIGGQDMASSSNSEEPSLIQYRSKRRCVMEREKKKKKEWWEEEDVLSDEEDFGDIDSDGSDGPRKKQRKKSVIPSAMLPPPNRIFMFSSELANRAAEAVMQGRVSSIVAYHRAQPQVQPFLRLQRNTPDFMLNHSAGVNRPYHFGSFPGHVPNMEGMFAGAIPGRPGASPMAMSPGYNSMQQYQQYLKQQQQQLEPRTSMPVDELQQMLFGTGNGPKGMFPSPGMPRSMDEQGAVRPPYGAYTGHIAPAFAQQQMFMNSHREERFRFPQPQTFPSHQQLVQQRPQMPPHQVPAEVLSQQPADLSQSHVRQQDESESGQKQREELQMQRVEEQKSEPVLQVNKETTQQRNEEEPSRGSQQEALLTAQTSPYSTMPPASNQAPQLPVLSPGSSISSSSPLSSSIRSPPPYSSTRATDMNTLPGASSISVPSPTNTNSPQTPHGPLTPRVPTSLASPRDGEQSPFSPGVVPNSGYPGQVAVTQQNIRDSSMKLARQSPNVEKADLQADKSHAVSFIGDSRLSGYSAAHNRLDMVSQRPNTLHLSRNTSPLAPPNKSPFLNAGSSPMHQNFNLMADLSASHHPPKFSVESLTAVSEKERFYHPRLSVQAAPPYASYSQQPGLFYAPNKFLPSMTPHAQYQLPAHLQTSSQQFFPPNMPPNMYPPPGSFPIHHTGNREGGL